MSLTVVVGGQYGSEGKGKVCSYLAHETDLAVRAGGPNSGHTVVAGEELYRLQQIPSTVLNRDCALAIAAGAIIDLDVLLNEVGLLNVADRLTIDPQATVIESTDGASEAELGSRIGSTMSGTGAAMARKVLRVPGLRLARDVPELQSLIGSVSDLANRYIDDGRRVLLEGSQGLGLSLHHGPFPYVTSRDTSPGTLCGEVGVSPRLVTDVILVLRTFPIRVAGNSGPLPEEITWEDVTQSSGYWMPLQERTTVTKNVRRVARFTWDVVEQSVRIARPSLIALNFVDYLNAGDYAKLNYNSLSYASVAFVEDLEARIGVAASLIGTGPEVHHLIDRRAIRAHQGRLSDV